MGSTFALADLHGQGKLWDKIKFFLHREDKLIFLGDAIDRGPEGIRIMEEMLKDERVVYLKGNHEKMMADALQEDKVDSNDFDNRYIWMRNGARSTYADWLNRGSDYQWIRRLRQLPVLVHFTNLQDQKIELSHAGFTPGGRPADAYSLVWDREHFTENIPDGNQTIIVHGHTPNIYLTKKFDEINSFYKTAKYPYENRDGAIFYAGGRKIDIDCGCFITGHTVLLDLNTWETIGFDAEIEE